MKDFPAVTLVSFQPLPAGQDQYPLEFIESRGAMKLRETETLVDVGLTENHDPSVEASLRVFHKKEVNFYTLEAMELAAYLGKILGDVGSGEGLEAGQENQQVLLDKLANDAPIVNLVNSICIEGIRSGASDIHIEAGPGTARVRYRLDGVLRTARNLDTARFPAIASRIKIMANLNILERRQPQDGRITVTVGKETVDLRVSIVPVAGGESLVLRILGKSDAPSSFEELGFDPEQERGIKDFLKVPHGLILVTGPTGSGKTTTLNAMIRELVSDELKLITIEDPVEYTVQGVNQIQINEQIGLGFEGILRRVLRQDPNIIMVGEIRDAATAELCVRAALTGHLVLSTLHTNDAVSVIPRLINMGVEPYLVASVLRGAIAQRLVRRLCPACSLRRPPDEREGGILRGFGLRTASVRDALDSGPFLPSLADEAEGGRKGKKGCPVCGGAAFKGRTVIAEYFSMDRGLEDLVLRGASLTGLSDYLASRGMRSLAAAALEKIASGITNFREVEREISFPVGGLTGGRV